MPLRPSLLSLAAALTLTGCADSGSPPTAPVRAPVTPALEKTTNQTDISRFDVSFTIPAGTCGLSTTVTATGVYQVVGRVSETSAGEPRVGITESAHGTATGEDGSQYRFNYVANYSIVSDPSTFPLTLDLVDHFNLIGQGGAPDIKVYLRGLFLYDGSLPVTPIGAPEIRGDLNCDPL
jgi:hypothetical protein